MRLSENERNKYFERLSEIKKRLPKHGVTSLIAARWPEYDSQYKKRRVGNVLQFRTIDPDIVDKLSEIADQLTPITVIKNLAIINPNDAAFGAGVRLYLESL